jgi:hypothetical protein
MPPIPFEYHGRDAVAGFLASVSRPGRRYDAVPARANGQLALALYQRDPAGGIAHGAGLDVFALAGDRIQAITHFDARVLASFGLPPTLTHPPDRSPSRPAGWSD